MPKTSDSGTDPDITNLGLDAWSEFCTLPAAHPRSCRARLRSGQTFDGAHPSERWHQQVGEQDGGGPFTAPPPRAILGGDGDLRVHLPELRAPVRGAPPDGLAGPGRARVPELRQRAGASAVLVRRSERRDHRVRPDRNGRWLRLRRLHLRELIAHPGSSSASSKLQRSTPTAG